MRGREHAIHFGLNCRHLVRDDYDRADCRCAMAIERYDQPDSQSPKRETPVPLDVAARFLELPEAEVARRAKAGDLPWSIPDSVAPRVRISTDRGERELTVAQAGKRLGVPLDELQKRIARGEVQTEYPDKFMRIGLMTRWHLEKCPLAQEGGLCYHFQPHDGPYISRIADAGRSLGTAGESPFEELPFRHW